MTTYLLKSKLMGRCRFVRLDDMYGRVTQVSGTSTLLNRAFAVASVAANASAMMPRAAVNSRDTRRRFTSWNDASIRATAPVNRLPGKQCARNSTMRGRLVTTASILASNVWQLRSPAEPAGSDAIVVVTERANAAAAVTMVPVAKHVS